MLNKIPLTLLRQGNPTNTGTVFFFHGSGDTGIGILEWAKMVVGNFSLPHIKFVFPTAPIRPYTPFNGELATVWFDRSDVTPDVPEHNETIEPMARDIVTLIENEVEAGIPLNKIIVGGFSMGGALALHMGYKYVPGLAGVFALSAFLNDNSAVYEKLQNSRPNVTPPLLMCHGERDDVVRIEWGKNTFSRLSELNVRGEFMSLKNTMHELKKSEMRKVLDWIVTLIPN